MLTFYPEKTGPFLGPSPSALFGKIQSTETYKNWCNAALSIFTRKCARWRSRVLDFFHDSRIRALAIGWANRLGWAWSSDFMVPFLRGIFLSIVDYSICFCVCVERDLSVYILLSLSLHSISFSMVTLLNIFNSCLCTIKMITGAEKQITSGWPWKPRFSDTQLIKQLINLLVLTEMWTNCRQLTNILLSIYTKCT